MTVETFTSHAPAIAQTHVPDAVQTLRAWASTYAEVASFVAPLVDTPFCPDAFRPKIDPRATADERRAARDVAVASATAAVLYGAGIGFDPLTALQNVYVVGGRPGLYAAAMVAIVQAAGHEVWTEDITDARAVVCGRRRGTQQVERVTVTIDGAKRAGWTRNAKYSSEPQAMLWARAASTVCRRIAQDALKGIGASVEELEDAGAQATPGAGTRTVQRAPQAPARALPTAAPATAERTAAARPAAPTQDGPPLPGEDDPAPPASADSAAEGEPASDGQLRALGAAFGELGIKGQGERADRLAIVSDLLGRQVASAKELNRDEASFVLDQLRGSGPQIVAEVLGRGPAQEAPAAAASDADGVLPVPGDDIDVEDPPGGEDYDPTVEPGFGAQ